MMLAGQLAGRILAYADFFRQPWTPPFDLLIAGILIWSAFYAAAAFGFRIFDPLPAARQAVFQQLPAGGVVFDTRGRVLSLNPAAETILGITAGGAHGKTWRELAPADEFLAERLGGANRSAVTRLLLANSRTCPRSRSGAVRTPGNMRRCSRRFAISAACS